jgi:ferric-dicitrate binding protein FerR (iron transport regulator)
MDEELLQRYVRGTVSDEEREKVARWLEEDPANVKEYQSLHKLYDISLWNDACKGRSGTLSFTSHIFKEVVKIAAVLIIGVLGTYYFLSKPETVSMQQLVVPSGQRAELTLSDGTKVWLNSRSNLKFPSKFLGKLRQVELDGEGYFMVKHNAKQPFIVKTNRYDIRVLGTEFNVKAYSNTHYFEASLLKGSIELSGMGLSSAVLLKPDEKAVQVGNKIVVSAIPDFNYYQWKDGIFYFSNETIEDLINKLEIYYDVKIVIHNKTLSDSRYSGKFRINDGIEHALKVLQLSNKFTFTKDDDSNTIVIN